ncbi:unnamed protein product [Protopolystoma xenopodis]|uniref:Uncharacterized protein n=1 Tax=Protopolystoma xenopodis TaxID=117903 RepID=A0A3S5AWJ1_9PLAT|nr:unnamed protein product [Protopolystoma xenopodis]
MGLTSELSETDPTCGSDKSSMHPSSKASILALKYTVIPTLAVTEATATVSTDIEVTESMIVPPMVSFCLPPFPYLNDPVSRKRH